MDREQKYWVIIWSLVALVCISAMALGTLASYLQRSAMADMVKNGADPMAVSCAFGIGQQDVAVCTLIYSKEKK